jgi:hypothetical protein
MHKNEAVSNAADLVLELVEAARRFGWKQAGGEFSADQEAIVKAAASKLGTAFKTLIAERDAANAMADQWAEKLEAAAVDAERYRFVRDADADAELPHVAKQRCDSWGNWRTEWLGSLEADRAIDAAIAASQPPDAGEGREGV